MKKPILIAILLSILILGGSYYYFYILNPVVEEPKLPKKQRIIIQKPVTSIQPKMVAKAEIKTDRKKEEAKPMEQKKVKDTKSKELLKEKDEQKNQKEIKPAEKEKKEVVSKPKRKPNFYSLVYVPSNGAEVVKIKDDIYNKGYHTVKVGKHCSKDAVIISPFTDKWEAEYVLKHLVQDTGIKEFKIIAVY